MKAPNPPGKNKMEKSKKSANIADIAKMVGVSKNAVSLALRNSRSISKETTKKILEAARKLGYVRNEEVSRVMSQIKSSFNPKFFAAIALINANPDRDAFKKHPTIPEYVRGIYKAARRESFAVNEFWLYDKKLNGASLARILRSRGIAGGIVVGLMDNNRLPRKFNEVWKNFKFVVTGVRTYNPTFDFVSTDHFLLAYRATLEALRRGYRRPALVLDETIDELIEGRFTGGYLKAQLKIPKADRIEPFFDVKGARKNREIFYKWFRENSPDAIITLYNFPFDWLREIGVEAPRDIALIQLEWRRGEPYWTGMNQRNDLVGESAVEHLSKILRQSNYAKEDSVRAILISPEWVESKTISKIGKKSARENPGTGNLQGAKNLPLKKA